MLDKYAGQLLPGGTLPTERQTGAALPSPFKFQQVRPKRHRSQRHLSPHRRVDRRHRRDPLDARRRPEPRTVAAADELRRCPADSPQPRLVVLLRPRQRKPEPAGFVSMCPCGYPIQETQNWQSGFLPGVYQGTYVDTQHTAIEQLIEHIRNDRISLPPSSANSSTCSQRLNNRHLQAQRRTTPRSKPASTRSSSASACRPKRPRRSTFAASRNTSATCTAPASKPGNS